MMRWRAPRDIWRIGANGSADRLGLRGVAAGGLQCRASRHDASVRFLARTGLTRLNGQPFPNETTGAQLWTPVQAGPSFLLTRNFFAIYAYNPSRNYALALLHLGDRIRGEDALARSFPGAERALTLAEVQEMQGLLIKAGFDTGPHTDGAHRTRTARGNPVISA